MIREKKQPDELAAKGLSVHEAYSFLTATLAVRMWNNHLIHLTTTQGIQIRGLDKVNLLESEQVLKKLHESFIPMSYYCKSTIPNSERNFEELPNDSFAVVNCSEELCIFRIERKLVNKSVPHCSQLQVVQAFKGVANISACKSTLVVLEEDGRVYRFKLAFGSHDKLWKESLVNTWSLRGKHTPQDAIFTTTKLTDRYLVAAFAQPHISKYEVKVGVTICCPITGQRSRTVLFKDSVHIKGTKISTSKKPIYNPIHQIAPITRFKADLLVCSHHQMFIWLLQLKPNGITLVTKRLQLATQDSGVFSRVLVRPFQPDIILAQQGFGTIVGAINLILN